MSFMMAFGTGYRECRNCGVMLAGRRKLWCSDRCRMAFRRAEEVLKEIGVGRRYCELCGEELHPLNPKTICRVGEDTLPGEDCYELQTEERRKRRAEQDAAEEARWEATCPCGSNAGWDGVGRSRKYCSNACRQRAYRDRKRAQLRGQAG